MSNPTLLNGVIQGSLAANTGGSYEYAKFNYPGDGSTVTLNLTVDNPLALENTSGGFAVYQGSTLIGTSSITSDPHTASLSFSSTTAGLTTVQVFDYDPNASFHYTLTPEGLPAQNAATTSATSTESAASATSATASAATTSTTSTTSTAASGGNGGPSTLSGSASGTLAGNSAGSIATYSLDYAGNGQTETISLTVSPTLPQENGAAGLNVYDASGNLIGTAQPTAPGAVSITLSNNPAGKYTVQIFNYDPTTTVSYTVSEAVS